LIHRGSFVTFLQAKRDGVFKHEGVTFGNAVICSVLHFFVKLIHGLAAKWRLEAAQLIHDTSEGPNIAVEAVGLIVPNLWTGVVRGASLGMREAIV
jgi:hypothetical protein